MKLLFENWKSYLHEGGLAAHQTEPRHEGNTPEERLINKLLIRSKIEKAGGDPQRAAEMLGLGEDEEVIAYLANLMGNPMLDNPNMEEAASTADQRDRKRDASARQRRREREEDPTHQKVKAASEKHLEKAKKDKKLQERYRKRQQKMP